MSNQNITSCGCKNTYSKCTNSILQTCSGQEIILTDMYNEWGKQLKWTLPVSSACTNWNGITCNVKNEIILIDLHNKLLTGTIPNSIGYLNVLTQLYLNNNQLNGTIPNSIGNLTMLNQLYLNSNQLNGTIPNSIGNLTALTQLHLNNNQLTGTIPNSIGTINTLTQLYVII